MTELLTPTAERESLGGGRYRNTIHLKPIAYRDGGILRPIVTDWRDGDAERPHIVTASRMMVSVAPDGARRIHPTREIDRYMEIGAPFIQSDGVWQQVQLGAPERSGNLLTWQTAAANLYIRHLGHAVKLGILLKGGWQPPNGQFAFPVGLQGLTRTGAQLYADGAPVMRLRPFTVEDLDNPQDIRPVAHQIVNQGGQWYVVCTLPSLAGMGRPLIDPTFDEQPDGTDGIDTFVAEGAATTNYGTTTTLRIHNAAGATRRRGLVKFDLSTIPAGASLTSGMFSLWQTAGYGSGYTVSAYRILSANSGWTEAGATWNTRDGSNAWAGDSGADGGTDAGCSQSGTDYNATAIGTCTWGNTADAENSFSLDTTELAAMISDNAGFYVIHPHADDRIAVHASDSATAGYRPKLVIEYTAGGTVYYGAAALSGAGALAAAGYRRVWTGVTLAGTGALAAAARRTRFGVATLPGAGALSSVAMTRRFAAATLAADGALQAQAIRALYGAAVLAGVGQLTATGRRQLTGGATLSGTATLTATAQRIAYAAAALVTKTSALGGIALADLGDTISATVTLDSDDSADVAAGRYVHQLVLVDADDDRAVVAEGAVTVKARRTVL